MRLSLFGMILAVFAFATAPAFATDPLATNDVINGQLNFGDVWANLNVSASDIHGDVNGTAAAIGNSFSAALADHSQVENFQRTQGAVASEVNATVANIEGDLNLTSAAVGNTASVHSHGGVPCPYVPEECPKLRAQLNLRNTQLVNFVDPSAVLNVTANGVGTVNGTAAAIGNSLSVEASGLNNTIESWQAINANTTSRLNASVSGAEGLNLTSAAVANTVAIDNLID